MKANSRSEVSSNDAMPGGVVLLVEFLLDIRSDILLDIVPKKLKN